MIASSLPHLLIMTGKLRLPNLPRLFSDLARFLILRLLTRSSLLALLRQKHPHFEPQNQSRAAHPLPVFFVDLASLPGLPLCGIKSSAARPGPPNSTSSSTTRPGHRSSPPRGLTPPNTLPNYLGESLIRSPPAFSVDLLFSPWYTNPKLFRLLGSFFRSLSCAFVLSLSRKPVSPTARPHTGS